MRYRDLTWLLLAGVMLGFIAHTVMADDSPPQTEVRICDGTLPATSLESNHDASCYGYTINATEKLAADVLNHNDNDTFRHVYYKSGDPACVFTGNVHYTNPDDPSWARHRALSNIAGGRDCNAGTPDGQCAYIAQGYTILATTGGSCSQVDVPICQGLFCR